jgi:hypothetical protein
LGRVGLRRRTIASVLAALVLAGVFLWRLLPEELRRSAPPTTTTANRRLTPFTKPAHSQLGVVSLFRRVSPRLLDQSRATRLDAPAIVLSGTSYRKWAAYCVKSQVAL